METEPYIRLHSGRKFHLLNPRPAEIEPADVAYHLARINRFTGASEFPVAQHCVVASIYARSEYKSVELARKMLIHDAAEFAYGDVNSPLKSVLPDYRRIITDGDLAVEKRFGVLFVGDPLVHELDIRMLLTERCQLWGGDVCEEDNPGTFTHLSVYVHPECWRPWSAAKAEDAWMTAYYELFGN